MRPDPISPELAEQIDTPKVVCSRNKAASPVHRLLLQVGPPPKQDDGPTLCLLEV